MTNHTESAKPESTRDRLIRDLIETKQPKPSDTPRTDQAVREYGHPHVQALPADLARQLERELNDANAEITKLLNQLEETEEEVSFQRRLIDEYDRDLDVANAKLVTARQLLASYRTSRDYHNSLRARAMESSTLVPEGYVLVPREPTQQMLIAGDPAKIDVAERTMVDFSHQWAHAIYKAMLAAAPTPTDKE